MELTRKQVIKNLNALNAVCGQKDFYDKEMEESMRYAISSLKIDEAYQLMYEGGEAYSKDEVLAMLTELKTEIEKIEIGNNIPSVFEPVSKTSAFYEGVSASSKVIQQRINAMRKNKT